MWRIIKSEIGYSWLFILTFGILISLVFVYEQSVADVPPMPFFLVLFMIVQTTLAIKNREKRERFFITLPVSSVKIAIARILVPVFFMLVLYFIYLITGFSFTGELNVYNFFPFITSLIILSGALGGYFIIRDFVLHRVRDLGITKAGMKVILVAILGGINILGVVTFIQASGSGRAPWLFRVLIYIIKNNLPFTPENILWQALSVAFILTAASVVSFRLSASHLE